MKCLLLFFVYTYRLGGAAAVFAVGTNAGELIPVNAEDACY
jgi:hypothetical protein